MPASESSKKQKKKKSTYTYSGCWTCRKRHLKCPEEKPECSRCLKAGLTCAGYDFRFGDAGSDRTFRRPVGAAASARSRQPALTSAAVNEILEDLDLRTESCRKGPFSVLSLRPKSLDNFCSQHSPSVANAKDGRGNMKAASQASSDTIAATPGLAQVRFNPSNMEPIPAMARELNLLTLPPKQARLFEFFTTTLFKTLSPMSDSPSNPFRHVYPALALEGLAAGPENASSRLAILHGICGTAAWSLRYLDSSYNALSVYHDGQTLQYIQQTIERQQVFDDALLPAAIMVCLAGDNVAGRVELWGRHVKAGLHCLLGALAQQKTKDSITSSVCQSYLLTATFSRLGSPLELDRLRSGIIGFSYGYIEECHGFTSPVLDALSAINLMKSSRNPYDPARVEDIGLRLRQAVPRVGDPFRHHLANVFYYAAWIYYTKALLHSEDTYHLASIAIDHLELATCFGPGKMGRILKWPLFTIGAECQTPELRNRMAAWCNSQLSVRDVEGFVKTLQSTWSISREANSAVFAGHSIPEIDG